MGFERVEYYFGEISKIPRGSGNEKGISDYLVGFAKEHGLECYRDEIYNVIIIKEASKGCEGSEPVILQGHIDMVCQKTLESEHDFTKDPITLLIDGDFLHADGTTLGGDDGIAVAYMLSILENDELQIPRIECVFTVSEEVGMDGAIALDVSPLKGKRLINIDSEEEGEFIAGCAGGAVSNPVIPVKTEERTVTSADTAIRLSVSGLLGGHSGMEIDKGRANAICKLAEILLACNNAGADFHIVSLSGGGRDNAIPFYAEAVLITNEPERLEETTLSLLTDAKKEFAETDPDILYKAEPLDIKELLTGDKCDVYTQETAGLFIKLMNALPNGILKMSEDLENIVETSLNWGILASDKEKISLSAGLRSMIDNEVDKLIKKIEDIASEYKATASVSGRYQAWQYSKHSPLREKMIEIYDKTHEDKAKVVVIHAGVECGTIAAKIPGLDAVSFGPNMYDVHTVNERLSISSAMRSYDFLLEVLKEI